LVESIQNVSYEPHSGDVLVESIQNVSYEPHSGDVYVELMYIKESLSRIAAIFFAV
jgi:hypothetical protein